MDCCVLKANDSVLKRNFKDQKANHTSKWTLDRLE